MRAGTRHAYDAWLPLVRMHYMWCMITISFIWALMYENLNGISMWWKYNSKIKRLPTWYISLWVQISQMSISIKLGYTYFTSWNNSFTTTWHHSSSSFSPSVPCLTGHREWWTGKGFRTSNSQLVDWCELIFVSIPWINRRCAHPLKAHLN